jgi:hypothetical protein
LTYHSELISASEDSAEGVALEIPTTAVLYDAQVEAAQPSYAPGTTPRARQPRRAFGKSTRGDVGKLNSPGPSSLGSGRSDSIDPKDVDDQLFDSSLTSVLHLCINL